MTDARLYTIIALTALAVMAGVVVAAPRCTPSSPDGLRIGGMLMAGCNGRHY